MTIETMTEEKTDRKPEKAEPQLKLVKPAPAPVIAKPPRPEVDEDELIVRQIMMRRLWRALQIERDDQQDSGKLAA